MLKMTKSFIKYGIILLISLLFATSYVTHSNLVDGIYSAKTFYFYAVIALIVFFSIMYLFIEKLKIIIEFNFVDLTLMLFYIYSALRLAFTNNIPIYNARFITFSLLIVFYWIVKFIYKKFNDKNFELSYYLPIIAFLVAGLGQGLLGIFQTYKLFGIRQENDLFFAVGTFGNPAPYAGFIVSVIPFAFGIYQLHSDKNKIDKLLKKLGFVTFIVLIAVLPLTETRGSWVASLSGLAIIIAKKYHLWTKLKSVADKKWYKLVFFSFAFVVIISVFISLYAIRPASAFGRLLIWKISLNMIFDNPIFGIGYDRFANEYNNYQADYFRHSNGTSFEIFVADNIKQCHNDYIETATELGLIGTILFILYLFITLKPVKESPNLPLIKSSQASILAISLSAFFSYPFQILPTLINIFFLSAIVSSSLNAYTLPQKYFIKHKVKIPHYFLVLLLFLLPLFAFREINNFNTYKKWHTALKFSEYKLYDEAISLYKQLYYLKKDNGAFLLNYGGTLTHKGMHSDAINVLEECIKINPEPNAFLALGISYDALNDFESSKNAFIKASLIKPNSYYSKYLLANLYKKYNKITEAKKIATEILQMQTKIPSYAVDQIKISMNKLLNEY